jgi:hypothetical protein
MVALRRLALIISAALLLCACGKVGPPVPPTRITARTSDLAAIQRGGKIMLTWPAPPLNAKDTSRAYIDHVVIYRLEEGRDQEPVLDPEDYADLAKPVGFMNRLAIEDQVKTLGHLEYADNVNLNDAQALANRRLRYAIRYVNNREQASLFSNSVAIEPAPTIAFPPTDLRAVAPRQDVITLSWQAPTGNVDGTRPAAIVGYNIYRRIAERTGSGELLNTEPLADTTYTDSRFQYKRDYVYIVRALSQGANGLIESGDSDELAFTPIDTFPPTAPDPVTVASANGVVSLFWPSAPERDVVGYNVYRAEAADAPDKDWIKLTAQPITPVTFRDDRVTIDQMYFYRVTALDRFDNESKPSRAVSETAHP